MTPETGSSITYPKNLSKPVLFRCVGCLLIYSLGFAFRWKAIAIFAPAVPILALLAGMAAPESPVYLLSRRQTHEARKALVRLYGAQYR